jgi:hypothetical protein
VARTCAVALLQCRHNLQVDELALTQYNSVAPISLASVNTTAGDVARAFRSAAQFRLLGSKFWSSSEGMRRVVRLQILNGGSLRGLHFDRR